MHQSCHTFYVQNYCLKHEKNLIHIILYSQFVNNSRSANLILLLTIQHMFVCLFALLNVYNCAGCAWSWEAVIDSLLKHEVHLCMSKAFLWTESVPQTSLTCKLTIEQKSTAQNCLDKRPVTAQKTRKLQETMEEVTECPKDEWT